MKRSITLLSGWGFKPTIWGDVTPHLTDFNIVLRDVNDFSYQHDSTNTSTTTRAIVGWSLGGLFATRLCAEYPAHFTHLILISSTPRFIQDIGWHGMKQDQADKQLRLANDDMTSYLRQFINLACRPTKSIAEKHRIKLHAHHPSLKSLLPGLKLLFTTDLRCTFANLSIPTLQITGEKDLVITSSQSLQSTTLRPHHAHTVKGAGHILMTTHANEIAQLIRDFLC